MDPTILFVVGAAVIVVLAVLLYVSFREVRVSPPGVRALRGLLPIDETMTPLPRPAPRPLRVVVAVDGSPCSDRAVQGVAARPWPAGTAIEVVSVARTRMPDVPDTLLMLEAAHVDALERERQWAPGLAARAQQTLSGVPDVTVTGTVLEGDPEDLILDEALRWKADLIVLGSHGYGPAKRRLLGSVSHAVAMHAPCSVEIVRCPGADGRPPARAAARDREVGHAIPQS